MEHAEKVLKGFLKELKKNGFTNSIKKHLNLVWQEDKFFKKILSMLKGVKFDYKNIKFVEKHDRFIYRFTVDINEQETNIFVQPLKEIGVPYMNGTWGVIPVKLLKFENKEENIELSGKDNYKNIQKHKKVGKEKYKKNEY